MKKREISLDILRSIAISCVLLLHIISIFRYKYLLDSSHYLFFTFLDVFTRIGVPIFFMLTGILMLNKKNEEYPIFIKKKIPRLLINYIVFSIIYILFDVIVECKNLSVKDSIQIILSNTAEYHLWYMPVIIMIYFLIPFLKKTVNNLSKKELNYLIMALFFLGNVTSSVSTITYRFGRALLDNFRYPNLMIYINYLFIGYYLNKYRPRINIKLIFLTLVSMLAIPFITLLVSNVEVVDFFLNSTSPFVIFISAFVVILLLNKNYDLSYKKEYFYKNISEISLYMYLIHVLILNIIMHYLGPIIDKTTFSEDLCLLFAIFFNVWIVSYIIASIINTAVNIMKSNKEKVASILIKAFNIIFGIIIFYIISSILINKYHFAKYSYPLLLLGILLIIALFYFIYKKQKYLFKNRVINVILLIVYFLFQISIIYLFSVRPTWDFGEIYNIAKDIAIGTRKIYSIYYLYICDNNIPVTVMLAKIFRIAIYLGLKKHLIIVGYILNILAIDISLYFTFKLIKRINNRFLIPFVIFGILFSPLVLYLPIFYTDTLVLPFVIIPIYYLYKKSFENDRPLYSIIIGVFLAIGALIKANIAILLIAIIIVYILKKNIKFKSLICIIIAFCIPILLSKLYINRTFSSYEMNRNRKPLTHFIMMGLKDYGGFNDEDMQFTTNISSYNEKKEKTIEKIKERLYNYSREHKLLEFYNRKINYTWTDATFYAPNKLSRSPINEKNQKYIQSNKSESILYYNIANAQWLIILMFITLGTIFSKQLSENERLIQLVSNISILGLFMFLLIWETRSRYLVCFSPLFMISSYMGLTAFVKFLANKRFRSTR